MLLLQFMQLNLYLSALKFSFLGLDAEDSLFKTALLK